MTRTSPARLLGLASAAVLLVLGTGFFFVPDTAEAQRSASSTRRGSSSSGSSASSSPSRSTSSRSGSTASRSSGSSQRSAVPRGSAPSGDSSVGRGRDVRRPRPGDDHRYRPGRGDYYGGHGWYYGPSYGGYYYRGYGGWPYFFGYHGPYWGFGWRDGPYVSVYRGGYYGHRTPQAGALDLDISPEKAEIWIDGEYVGVADQYDGWPDYLWLPRGSYDLVAYKDGYRTLERRVAVRAGSVVEMDDDLERGPSVTPDEIFARSAAARIERRDRVDDRRDGGDWRDRVPDDRRVRIRVEERHEDDSDDWRARRGDDEREVEIEVEERREDDSDGRDWQGRSETARLELSIEPADAAVYLDGRFIGTAAEIGDHLEVEAGDHEIEVVRPGLEPQSFEFEAEPGARMEMRVILED